ncbi:Uridine phosphorylase [Salmonella enterica subsp. enterica serovar Montevideo str. S5-403]|uniref:Uridine phosphorylase n=1 Tax=Salmonella enterica subsp. enterica serovar Montevideo str. S5-403 TaxID=913242 RepID=G5QAI7_SALMO|nr:Uridine phosphorylase [Salmonella enterica subsp. enterica serovar Montevideo str. S5-403]
MLSTGIGGPSTAIAIEELRQVGVNTLIRIGSCGALQDSLALGDVIIASDSYGLSPTARWLTTVPAKPMRPPVIRPVRTRILPPR